MADDGATRHTTERCSRVKIRQLRHTRPLNPRSPRPPRKRRPRTQIPLELSPLWQQLVDVALANHPHLAPFMSDATLTRIDAKRRTAFVIANTEAAATVLMAEPNRYAIQRGLRTIFKRPLVVRVSCSK